MKAMILAAGRGERMGTLTTHTPKPLLKAGGRSLISYHLENLAHAGIHEVVINLHYLGDQLQATLGDGSAYGLRIQYSPEHELLGIGGGILNALPLLGDEPFIIISADVWTDYPLANLPKTIDNLAHLVMVDNPPYHHFALSSGQLSAYGLCKLDYAGIGVMHPRLFADCQPGAFEIFPVFKAAMHNGLISGEHFSGRWYNVGTPTILQTLNRQLL